MTIGDNQGEVTDQLRVAVDPVEFFRLDVLAKLGRMESKIDMIVGNGQPGRMKLAEDRLTVLERSDVKRNTYDRIVITILTLLFTSIVSTLLALRPWTTR